MVMPSKENKPVVGQRGEQETCATDWYDQHLEKMGKIFKMTPRDIMEAVLEAPANYSKLTVDRAKKWMKDHSTN